MTKGKIDALVIVVIVLVGGGITAGMVIGKNKDDKQEVATKNTETKATAEVQAPAPKPPTALPMSYSGTGDYESEIFTLADGAISLSASLGVDKGSIHGSGGYASIGVKLINVDKKSFPGVDEYNSGEDGTLNISTTINKSDGQSTYTLSEQVKVVSGDYKLEVKGGPSGFGPQLTNWTAKLY